MIARRLITSPLQVINLVLVKVKNTRHQMKSKILSAMQRQLNKQLINL